MADIKEETKYLDEIKLFNCEVLVISVKCNNPVKVQVVADQVKPVSHYFFQFLKGFGTAVTLQYIMGHWQPCWWLW